MVQESSRPDDTSAFREQVIQAWTYFSLIHWLAEGYVQLDFTAEYLKLLQFLVVSHFYWKLATRAIRKESLTNRLADLQNTFQIRWAT